MTIHLALLRGINVGGHKQVAMTALRLLEAEAEKRLRCPRYSLSVRHGPSALGGSQFP